MAAKKSAKRRPKDKRRGVDPTEVLLQQARELGVKSFVVMPIDEIAALRHMEAWEDQRVLNLFIASLEDPAGWCRYDAAWALGESGTGDPRALAGLRKLARGAQSDPPLSDGAARAKSQAAESLARLAMKEK